MSDLFSSTTNPTAGEEGGSKEKTGVAGSRPLADRIRPCRLEDVVGQDHLLGEGKFLTDSIRSGEVPSLIFWGPPGVGKTTLAHLIAGQLDAYFVSLSAVLSGVKDVKQVIEEAKYQRKAFNRDTLLFVDEIHRFNKAQQDAFLPHVEDGTITLIGATTENPSFEVISPLLSRCRVLVLEPLSEEAVVRILERALEDAEEGFGDLPVKWNRSVLRKMANFAGGDARSALNALEMTVRLAKQKKTEYINLSDDVLQEALQHRSLLYDKSGEEHFNLISALHKSLRNSDADAAIYWLGRMLEAGEDPLYIARRMVRFASEDVGLADPRALRYSLDAMEAFQFLGLPEGKLALAQAALYLALAPKSNAVHRAYGKVQKEIRESPRESVPLHLRNAPTRLMKDLDYGKGYRYAHDEKDGVADMKCLPEALQDRQFYDPTSRGLEEKIARRLEALRARLKDSSN